MKTKIMDCFKLLFNVIHRVFYPPCWIELGTLSIEWDRKLNLLIKKAKVVEIYRCTIIFENDNKQQVEVWIENFPYSYGHVWVGKDTLYKLKPMILTKLRLNRLVKRLHKEEAECIIKGL